jgi:hypothetical protein
MSILADEALENWDIHLHYVVTVHYYFEDSAGTVTGYGLGSWEIGGWFMAVSRDFSLLKSIKISTGTYSVSWVGFFHKDKVAGEWSWQLTSI